MKTRITTTILSAALLLTACHSDDNKLTDGPLAPAKLEGIFARFGYGQVFDFSAQHYRLYSTTSQYCRLEQQGNIAELEIKTLQISDKGQTITAALPGSTAFPVQLRKLNQLPDSCTKPLTDSQNARLNFEYFWHSVNELYAFFPQRHIDWAQRYQQYQHQITDKLSDAELFDLLSTMLADFADSHVMLLAEIDGEAAHFSAAPATELAEMAPNFELTEAELRTALQQASLALMQHYAGTTPLQTSGAAQPLWWGLSEDNVGYIMLQGLAGYSADAEDIQADVAAARQAFSQMMAALAGADAVILDNRFNVGGYDDIAAELARFFIAQSQTVLTKQVNNLQATNVEQTLQLSPAAQLFTGPLFLINSEVTVSAAETFSIMLKDQPQVTLLGQPSNGALSDMLEKQLPNGWLLTLSNETYLDQQRQSFEVSGIPVDIETPVFSQLDYELQKVSAYDTALALLEKSYRQDVSTQDLEHIINQAITGNIIPGIAVAMVNKGELKYSKGFGKATENTQVTAETPFVLASVSKVFNGTLAALLVEQGRLDPDTEVRDDIGISMTLPNHVTNPVKLWHLLSHTSGIADSDAYHCGYYFSEGGQSMLNALQAENSCPEPVQPELEQFLQDYLNSSGSLYSAANYQLPDGIQPGQQYHYSNIGSALAARMMSYHLSSPFDVIMTDELLLPLGLNQTKWDLPGTQLPDTATRYIWQDATNSLVPLPHYRAASWPDGFLTSSAEDLAKFAQAVMNPNHPLLSDKIRQRMLQPLTSIYPGKQVGYHWITEGSYLYHDGSDPGTETLLLLQPASQSALVILINTGGMADWQHPALAEFISTLKTSAWHTLLGL